MKHRKIFQVIVIIIFVLMFAVPAVIYWCKGEAFQKSVSMEKKQISESYERRFREGAFKKLSLWLEPPWYKKAREEAAKKAQEEAKKEAAKQAEEEAAQQKKDPILQWVPQTPMDLPYLAPSYGEDVIIGRDGWLFINQMDSLNYYLGNSIMSDWEMEDYKNSWETLDNLLATRGVKLAVVVGPDKEQVYPECMPTYLLTSEYKRYLLFEKYMHENSNVHFYYPIRELAYPKGVYDTYYVADTHWNEAGALIAVEKIYEAFGMQIDRKKDVHMNTEPTTKGDVGIITGNSTTYTDYRIDYKPHVTYKENVWDDNWDIDYHGKTYTSTNKNGKRVVVFGDSFRVLPARIMAKDFETVNAIHRNSLFNWNQATIETLQSLKEGDCFAFVTVERLDIETRQALDYLISILQ